MTNIPVNATLFEGLCRNNEVKMKSLGWSSPSKTGILTSEGRVGYRQTRRKDVIKMEAEVRLMLPKAKDIKK